MNAFRAIDLRRIELIDAGMVDVLRRKSAAERIAMVFDAERTMRQLLEAYLRSRHPEWNQRQVAQEIARRRSGGPS